nr:efflux RND transporter periplasmic adaptor subunit [Methylocystis bryophila]
MAGALIALAVIAGGGAFWGWRHGRLPLQSREESSSAVVATIHARETTPITAETSGVIGAVYCKRGEAVRAGQPCARIEARGLQDELARQELALRQRIAEAERARAEAGQAKAAADRMARGGARKQKALSAARRAYERAQARALSEDAAMTTAEAAINATKATLKTAELVSPIDGTIVGRAVDVGKMVRAGEPSFLVASDIGVVKIEAQVDAAFAATHRLGDAIAFRVDDIPGQLFHGKLTQMSQEPAAGGADEMSVVLRASNEDGLLQPGSSIRIRFEQSGTGL